MSDHQLKPVEPVENQNDQAVLFTATVSFLDVLNMDCSKCAVLVRKELSQLDGVLVVEVFLEKGVVVVTYDPDWVTTDDLLTSIAKAGLRHCKEITDRSMTGLLAHSTS